MKDFGGNIGLFNKNIGIFCEDPGQFHRNDTWWQAPWQLLSLDMYGSFTEIQGFFVETHRPLLRKRQGSVTELQGSFAKIQGSFMERTPGNNLLDGCYLSRCVYCFCENLRLFHGYTQDFLAGIQGSFAWIIPRGSLLTAAISIFADCANFAISACKLNLGPVGTGALASAAACVCVCVCVRHACVVSQVWVSRVIGMGESCHACERVMSCISRPARTRCLLLLHVHLSVFQVCPCGCVGYNMWVCVCQV